MATTTNYGWTTPDDTALVKDGAAAIRTLGTSIDTTTKNLNPSTTLGDIEYRSSTANTNTRLAIGTTGQVLTVSGGVPAWTTVSSGGMTLISETVASANSSISLSSIPGTYKQLLLMWSGIRHSATGSQFSVRFNNNSNSIYHMNNTGFLTTNIETSANAYNSIRALAAGVIREPFGRNTTNAALETDAQGTLLIDNYSSSSKFKYFNCVWGFYDNTDAQAVGATRNGTFADTTAITSIDIVRLSGTATISNTTNTSIRLYGLS